MDALFKALESPTGLGGLVALVIALVLAVGALWLERRSALKRQEAQLEECQAERKEEQTAYQAELKILQEARIAELRLSVEAMASFGKALDALTITIDASVEARHGGERGFNDDGGADPRRGRKPRPG